MAKKDAVVKDRTEYQRNWRKKNAEKCREAVRRCREKHKDEYREQNRKRNKKKWDENPEWRVVLRDRKRAAYNSNQEHRRVRLEANRRWRKTEKGRHFHRVYELNRPRKDRYKLPYSDWEDILKSQNNQCAMCHTDFSNTNRPQRDHIFPRILGGVLTKENTQALCKSCNSKKGTKIKAA